MNKEFKNLEEQIAILEFKGMTIEDKEYAKEVCTIDKLEYEGKEIIDYEIYNFFLWTGIQACFMPADWITLSLTSEVAMLSCFFDFDHHKTNDKHFIDIGLSSFRAFRQSVKAEFKIKKVFSLCQTTTFMFTGESHGTIYAKTIVDDSYKQISNTEAGSQTIYVDLQLSSNFSW